MSYKFLNTVRKQTLEHNEKYKVNGNGKCKLYHCHFLDNLRNDDISGVGGGIGIINNT